MKKIFLIPLLTLLSCVMAWGEEVGTFAELQTALAGSDATITLTGNITATGWLIANRTVTLDLNSHVLTFSSNALAVQSNGVLTLQNGTINAAANTNAAQVEGGQLILKNSTLNGKRHGVWVASGSLDVQAGTVITGSPYQGVYMDAGTITVNGGSITGNNDGVYMAGGAITVNSGAVIGNYYNAIEAYNATITVNGGTLTGSAVANAYNSIYAQRSSVYANGGNFVSKNYGIFVEVFPYDQYGNFDSAAFDARSDYYLTIGDDCIFDAPNGVYFQNLFLSQNISIGTPKTIESDGIYRRVNTYEQLVSALSEEDLDGIILNDGYMNLTTPATLDFAGKKLRGQLNVTLPNKTDVVTIKNCALSSETNYGIVLHKGKAVVDNCTINMTHTGILSGITLTRQQQVTGKYTLATTGTEKACRTLELVNSTINIEQPDNMGMYEIFGIKANGYYDDIVTIDNCNIQVINYGETSTSGAYGINADKATKVSVNNTVVYAQIADASGASASGISVFGISNTEEKTTLTVSGDDTNISSNVFGIAGNGSADAQNTVINISGGTIGNASTFMGIYHPQEGTLTISGGTINGLTGIGIKSGSLTMTGGTINAVGEKAVYETGYDGGALRTGAAISIESNGNYAGNMAIAISDAAKLQSAQGYALYEYVANYNAPTKVNTITVANGLFQGGISVSQSLAAKGGFVSGGKWSVDVTANVAAGKAANPIDEDPYFFGVGDPTPETAEIKNDDSKNAVLTNTDGEAYAASYSSEAVGNNAEVKTPAATNQVVISENTDVVVDQTDENNSTIVEVKKVTVKGDAQLNVKEGATLMVGAGSVLLDEGTTTGGLTVEAGAALVVDGLVYGSTEENFVIKGEEDKSAIVLFSPETEFIKEDHPTATYRFTSKSFRDGSKWVYQRFGMPSFDGTVTVKSGNLAVNSYICTWDYATDDWGAWSPKIPEGGLVYAGEDKAVPFQCYQLGSTNAKDAPVTYDFVVELMGNANAPLNFKAGWNPYANSYTAPIDIKEFLTDVIANNGSDILATIYLYKDLGNDTYTWQGINLSNVGKTYRVRENGAMVKKTYDASIEPMQAFIMKLSNGEDATTDINYLNNVYNPAMGIERPAGAPARNRASYNEMQIGAYNDLYWDNISVMEGEQFSAAEDNGYDAPKYDHNKGLSLYVINGEQHMERVATDNADGLFIGINAPVAGTYTLDFSGIVGMDYSLIDMTNNTVVKIEEDGQYNFYAEAGQNDYRFQLVTPAKVPTAIENTAAKTNMKGVYTITGQYLGADINALPKGVYIINGAKVVK